MGSLYFFYFLHTGAYVLSPSPEKSSQIWFISGPSSESESLPRLSRTFRSYFSWCQHCLVWCPWFPQKLQRTIVGCCCCIGDWPVGERLVPTRLIGPLLYAARCGTCRSAVPATVMALRHSYSLACTYKKVENLFSFSLKNSLLVCSPIGGL